MHLISETCCDNMDSGVVNCSHCIYQYFDSKFCALNSSCGAYYRRPLYLVSIVKARILALYFALYTISKPLAFLLLYSFVSYWGFKFVHMHLSTMIKYVKEMGMLLTSNMHLIYTYA